MPLSNERLEEIVVENLTPDERRGGVVYVSGSRLAAGAELAGPGASIDAPHDAFVAFVDGAALANWSHPARYVLVDPETGDVKSFGVQFPPRRDDPAFQWRVAYRAPSVPDAALGLIRRDR